MKLHWEPDESCRINYVNAIAVRKMERWSVGKFINFNKIPWQVKEIKQIVVNQYQISTDFDFIVGQTCDIELVGSQNVVVTITSKRCWTWKARRMYLPRQCFTSARSNQQSPFVDLFMSFTPMKFKLSLQVFLGKSKCTWRQDANWTVTLFCCAK